MAAKKHFAAVYLLASLLGGFTVPVHAEESVDTWEKVVFHLDETANARWALMLARSYLDDTPRAKVVIVAYGPGVDFLMDDATDKRGDTYADAVLSLIGRGVEFRVCAATLGAREIVKDDLIEGVAVVPSGISEIARLQLREGYAYLKP
jgi:intracellular sulfur oxidation DsrE/DsrF family protein